MKTLREKYDTLESEVNKEYSRLVGEVKEISFYDEDTEEVDVIYDLDTICYVNNNGDTVDAKVLKISAENGIYIAKSEDTDKRFWVGLNDLSDIYYKILITELLELNFAVKS